MRSQYTDLSNRTVGMVCGTGPGSYGHYDADARTFAAAGADFLKVDYCAYDQSDTSRYQPSIPMQLRYSPFVWPSACLPFAACLCLRAIIVSVFFFSLAFCLTA